MRSFKSDSPVQPIYDFYVETDDQPIDYSKRYADQDSYEERCMKKSTEKSDQYSTPGTAELTSKSNTRNYTDEVKIYCMEGTPVTMSSASSLSDLRTICGGPPKSSLKPNLPSLDDEDDNSHSYENKKSAESEGNVKDKEIAMRDRNECSKEVKSVSFRNSENISKASSPMMFSRSSSLGSLTSFEQSGADDQSSVSAFSALNSGIISPSDLPDSPGDLMPAAFSNKACHSKIQTFKDDSDKEDENEDLSDKESTLPQNVLEHENYVSTDPRRITETEEYMPLMRDLSDRNSIEEGNNILDQQFELMHDSSADLDDVFTDPDLEKDGFVLKSERDSVEQLSENESDDEGDMMLQQCIQLGMLNQNSSDKYSVLKDQDQHHNIPQVQVIPKPLVLKEKLEVSESKLSQLSLQPKMLESTNVDCAKAFYKPEPMTEQKLDMMQSKEYMPLMRDLSDRNSIEEGNDILDQQFELMHESSADLDDVFTDPDLEKDGFVLKSERDSVDQLSENESDDEDDMMLQQCIQLGMQNENSSDKYSVLKDHNIPQVQVIPKPLVLKENLEVSESKLSQLSLQPKMLESNNVNCAKAFYKPKPMTEQKLDMMQSKPPIKFDDDDSDEDGILQQCIQLGMPSNSPGNRRNSNIYQQRQISSILSQSFGQQVNTTKEPSKNSSCLPKGAFVSSNQMLCEMRKKIPPNRNDGEEHDVSQSLSRSVVNAPLKFDDESDEDGLLQQCVQLGMPNKSFGNKVDSSSYQPRNNVQIISTQINASKDFSKINSNPLQKEAFQNPQNHVLCKTPQKMLPNRNSGIKHEISQPLSRNFRNVPFKFDDDDSDDDGILQQCIQLGMPKNSSGNKSDSYLYQQRKNANISHQNINNKMGASKEPSSMNSNSLQKGTFVSQNYNLCRMQQKMPSNRIASVEHGICQSYARNTENDKRDACPDGVSDGDEDNDILEKCILAGMPIPKTANDVFNRLLISQSHCNPKNNDSVMVYRTEDTPILSPSHSVSALSTLSFTESFLNNSRNSNYSSESEDDELMLQCIRSGMPEARRAVV